VSRFRATPEGATAKFSIANADLLAGLARQLASLLAVRDDSAPDPALERLFPDAYIDSPEDAAEFRRFTETELGDEKIRGALALAAALEPVTGKKRVTVDLDADEAFAWLRTFTDIRLALATRLGIDDDGRPHSGGQLDFAIYNWLGYLQDTLVRAVDR
jgi:hypothetical protein